MINLERKNGQTKIAATLIVAFFVLLSFGTNAQAARVEPQKDVAVTNNFDLGPTSFAIEADPGQTVTRTLQVTNRKGHDQQFLVEVEDFEGSGDPGQTITLHGKESGRFGAKDWVETELSDFTIAHGDRQFFDVTIKIPDNADAGDHYATVLVSAPPQVKEEDQKDKTAPNVRITSRVGTLFFIRVRGDIKEAGALEGFKTDRPWYEKGPVTFSTLFKNTGSVRLQPYGQIDIKNHFGTMVDTLNIEKYNVLRDSVREMNYEWNKKWLVGRFTATVRLNNGIDDQPSEMVLSFWVIPWKEGSVALLALAILLGIVVFIKKKFKFSIQIQKKDDESNANLNKSETNVDEYKSSEEIKEDVKNVEGEQDDDEDESPPIER